MNSLPKDYGSLESLNEDIVVCRKCPRLVKFRLEVLSESRKYQNEEFWRKPVTGFGDHKARLIVVGLAPAASGANRTGRVFTGDKSSDILVSAFHAIGLSNIPQSVSRSDGLEYRDLFLTLAVRCVPPDNRPSNVEISNCLHYLESEIKLVPTARSIVALGTVAFNSLKAVFRNWGFPVNGMKFSHGNYYQFGTLRLYCCYHPSPRNINTGRTSLEDIRKVIKEAYRYASA